MQSTYIDALDQLARMEELPIRFTDIRPGFVSTPLLNRSHRYPLLMEPGAVARSIVEALDRGRRRAVIDGRYALLVALWRMIPQWLWVRLKVRNRE